MCYVKSLILYTSVCDRPAKTTYVQSTVVVLVSIQQLTHYVISVTVSGHVVFTLT